MRRVAPLDGTRKCDKASKFSVGEDRDFVEEWRPFVASIAHRVRASLDIKGDLDDLLASGMEGLIMARSRFDPSRGVKFNTFAYYRVRGAMLDHIRRMAFLPAKAHRLVKAAAAGDDVLEAEAESRGATPLGAQGQKTAAKSLERIDDALGKLTASFVLAAVGQDGEQEVETPESAAIGQDEAARLRASLDVLPERERALVQGFYFEGRRFDEVAEDLGISKSWASRLHTKALSRLRRALGET
jgi:RNA polymerase sigma factor for flagellar operon FliA